jgi:hypothetical protein
MAGPVPQAIIQAGQLGTIAKGQILRLPGEMRKTAPDRDGNSEPSAMRKLSQLKAWGRERVTTRFV